MARISTEWSFTVADVRRRVADTVGSAVFGQPETVPRGRIQAVRMVEPLWFRPLGWCRLELHLAGGVKVATVNNPHGSAAPYFRSDPSLMPRFSCPCFQNAGRCSRRPPRRAMLRAPLSYHFLQAGVGERCAVAVFGRIRRETIWVPLTKAQSLRAAQGPIQRSLGLASIHVDAAGRHTGVTLRDRDAIEAVLLMEELPGRCYSARDLTRSLSAAMALPQREDAQPPTNQALPDA